MLTFSRTEYPIDSVFLLQDLDTHAFTNSMAYQCPAHLARRGPLWSGQGQRAHVDSTSSSNRSSWTSNMPSFPPFLFMSTAQQGRHLLNGGTPNSPPTRLRYLTRC